MQMTKAQAIAELEHIYEILPLIAEAVKEEKKPINQYGKTSYFRDMYGQSMGTVNNRKEGIRREIKSGRYPESALIERFIDKAVYADYNRFFKHLEGAGRKYVPAYDPLEVIQIRKRKPVEQLVRKPDTYDKVVEKAFWFVIGFSVALMVCCVAFGQI